MDSLKAHGDPSDVMAEEGDVIVEGPNGVAVTLTPEAAEETGRRMLKAATEARRQLEATKQA
ncbi:MAG TPA: hypothetical protein VF704_11560 [Allosphingosinicella sp.]|jgi:hypothetical protein